MISGFILPPFPTTVSTQAIAQEKIDWVLSEEEGLKQAKDEGKAAMIDFWASWCAAVWSLKNSLILIRKLSGYQRDL